YLRDEAVASGRTRTRDPRSSGRRPPASARPRRPDRDRGAALAAAESRAPRSSGGLPPAGDRLRAGAAPRPGLAPVPLRLAGRLLALPRSRRLHRRAGLAAPGLSAEARGLPPDRPRVLRGPGRPARRLRRGELRFAPRRRAPLRAA